MSAQILSTAAAVRSGQEASKQINESIQAVLQVATFGPSPTPSRNKAPMAPSLSVSKVDFFLTDSLPHLYLPSYPLLGQNSLLGTYQSVSTNLLAGCAQQKVLYGFENQILGNVDKMMNLERALFGAPPHYVMGDPQEATNNAVSQAAIEVLPNHPYPYGGTARSYLLG